MIYNFEQRPPVKVVSLIDIKVNAWSEYRKYRLYNGELSFIQWLEVMENAERGIHL